MEATLTYIGFGIFFVPLITGLIRWKRLSGGQKVLVAYIGFVILFSIIAEIVGRTYGTNLPLYHFYTFVEFFTLFYLFWRSMRRIPQPLFILPALVFAGIGIWTWVIDGLAVPVMSRTAASVILIGFSLLFFYNALRYLEYQRIEHTFMFWMSGAVLLYFTGNLLLYVFGDYIAQASDKVFFTVWSIHALLNIVLYLLYAVALLWKDLTPPSSQSLSSAP